MSKKAEFFELLDEILVEMEDHIENKKAEDAEFEAKIEQLQAFKDVLAPAEEEETEENNGLEVNVVRADKID